MTLKSVKVSDLAVATTLSANDKVVVLSNTSGTPVMKSTTVATLTSISNVVPATASSNGTPGSIAFDATNLYVCVANSVWVKAALTTW